MPNESLSQYVRRIMKQKGFNARDIERNSNKKIDNSYISKIISGKVTNLTADKTVALAAGLGVSPFEVFAAMCGQSLPAEGEQPLDGGMVVDILQKLVNDPRLIEILQLCEGLSPEDQDVVLVRLRYLREKSKKQPKSRKQKKR